MNSDKFSIIVIFKKKDMKKKYSKDGEKFLKKEKEEQATNLI